jgi:hypothetical protein
MKLSGITNRLRKSCLSLKTKYEKSEILVSKVDSEIQCKLGIICRTIQNDFALYAVAIYGLIEQQFFVIGGCSAYEKYREIQLSGIHLTRLNHPIIRAFVGKQPVICAEGCIQPNPFLPFSEYQIAIPAFAIEDLQEIKPLAVMLLEVSTNISFNDQQIGELKNFARQIATILNEPDVPKS